MVELLSVTFMACLQSRVPMLKVDFFYCCHQCCKNWPKHYDLKAIPTTPFLL